MRDGKMNPFRGEVKTLDYDKCKKVFKKIRNNKEFTKEEKEILCTVLNYAKYTMMYND